MQIIMQSNLLSASQALMLAQGRGRRWELAQSLARQPSPQSHERKRSRRYDVVSPINTSNSEGFIWITHLWWIWGWFMNIYDWVFHIIESILNEWQIVIKFYWYIIYNMFWWLMIHEIWRRMKKMMRYPLDDAFMDWQRVGSPFLPARAFPAAQRCCSDLTTNPQVTEHGNRRIHQSKPNKKPWFVQIAHFISKLSKFVQKIPWTQNQDHLKIWKDDCQISSFSLANIRNGRPSRWVTTCHDASRFGLAQPPECARPRVAGGSGDCAHGRAPLRAEAQETARKTHLDSAGWNSNEFQFEKFNRRDWFNGARTDKSR